MPAALISCYRHGVLKPASPSRGNGPVTSYRLARIFFWAIWFRAGQLPSSSFQVHMRRVGQGLEQEVQGATMVTAVVSWLYGGLVCLERVELPCIQLQRAIGLENVELQGVGDRQIGDTCGLQPHLCGLK